MILLPNFFNHTSGNNTISFLPLCIGTYSDCTIIVTDSEGNASNTLAVTTFFVDTTPADDDDNTSSSSGGKFVAVDSSGTIISSTSSNLWGVTPTQTVNSCPWILMEQSSLRTMEPHGSRRLLEQKNISGMSSTQTVNS